MAAPPFPSTSLNPLSGSVQSTLPATYRRQEGLSKGPALKEVLLPTPSLGTASEQKATEGNKP